MFKEIGQLAGLMKNLPKIREEMDKLQQRLRADRPPRATPGPAWSRSASTARWRCSTCLLSDEAMKAGDREMLEDLIQAAVNQAIAKVRQQIAEETTKMAASLGLPPGMGLPGMLG